MTYFFTADEHYFHSNIIKYCDRPFKNEYEMRKTLITNHNKVVGNDDTTFHVGDFAMINTAQIDKVSGVLKQLKGRHHLILGNHDICKPQSYVDAGFISVHTAFWFDNIVMVHDPSVYCACRHELGILAHGHIHTLYKTIRDMPVVNVGVDVQEFYPVTINQITDQVNYTLVK